MGRAASPPTWACYEQIQNDYSDSDSCSEDDEDYNDDRGRDSDDNERSTSSHVPQSGNESDDIDMDMDEDGSAACKKDIEVDKPKDVKGKQRAVDPPEPESPRRPRKKRRPTCTLRPILTIQKSQGFVWNQVCFRVLSSLLFMLSRFTRIYSFLLTSRIDVRTLLTTLISPSDHCFPDIASTSPPNSRGFIPSSVSSNSSTTDYEVEVVEIRVKEGEIYDIIP